MMIHLEVIKRTFRFRFNAKTSRGLLKDRVCWFLKVSFAGQPEVTGLGEVAPLEGLSSEGIPQVENELLLLKEVLKTGNKFSFVDPSAIETYYGLWKFSSSIRFGAVTALLDLFNGGNKRIFDAPFSEGIPIPINGLVWMDEARIMLENAEKKISEGFNCIKLKVGSLQFEEECSLIEQLRLKYGSDRLTIRLDANGAFSHGEVESKLNRLAQYDIHSIEQPLNPKDTLKYPQLLKLSPVPVALDEQLIGNYSLQKKSQLLQALMPAFLVIKPGLTGGFSEAREWISLAEDLKIGWWITSALESPIGLNAIAQFTSQFHPDLPQGLGTGNVFENPFEHPLRVENGFLTLKKDQKWGF
ncbi:MAG: o-succinylbenzoate synthase [Cyclobacteriaceae bacterium]